MKKHNVVPVRSPSQPLETKITAGRWTLLRRKWRALRKSLPFYLAVTLVVAPFAIPLVWMISASLRTPGLPPPRTVEWIPSPAAWGNYGQIFQLLPFGRYLLNSLIVSALGVALTLASASWAGLGMALLGRQARFWLLILSVGLLMIPVTALWLARFILFDAIGLIDTYLALVAPALMGSSPFYILLFYWAFRRITPEIFEAARLEGAVWITVWRMIAMPLVRPTITAVSVLSFILYWNDFINPLIYLKSQSLYTLAVGLQQLQQLDKTNWPLLLAGAVVMTLPVVLLFLLVQNYLLREHQL